MEEGDNNRKRAPTHVKQSGNNESNRVGPGAMLALPSSPFVPPSPSSKQDPNRVKMSTGAGEEDVEKSVGHGNIVTSLAGSFE